MEEKEISNLQEKLEMAVTREEKNNLERDIDKRQFTINYLTNYSDEMMKELPISISTADQLITKVYGPRLTSFSAISSMMNAGQIVEFGFEPEPQKYANEPNKLATFIDVNGDRYYVLLRYDVQRNEINPLLE